LLNELNRRQFAAWDSKTIKDIEAYYNAIRILFLEVEPLLDKDEIERIKAKMKDAWKLYMDIITARTITPTVLIFFLNKLDKINEAIRISMQMHEYFFQERSEKGWLGRNSRKVATEVLLQAMQRRNKCGMEFLPELRK